MKKSNLSSRKRFSFARFFGLTAIILAAAVLISAFPHWNARAEFLPTVFGNFEAVTHYFKKAIGQERADNLAPAVVTTLVNYDFASAVAGTPCTAAALTAAGVTSSFTTGGTGGGTCTTPAGTAATMPPAFVANASNQSVSLTSFATGSTNYFQFQLSGVGSYQDYMIFFQSQRSGTGPVNAAVQYSTNGTSFTTFQTVNPGNGVFAAFNIDLSAVTAIENQPTVYFRILGSGGSGAAGTFRVDNFQVQANSVVANLTIAPAVGTEADSTQFTATVTTSANVNSNQTVNFALTGGTASAADFTSIPTQITIPSGSNTGTATFSVVNDTLIEPTETGNFAISSPSTGISLGTTTSASVDITDNDAAPAGTIQFSAPTYTGSEAGQSATLTVTRTGGSNGAISANYSFSDLTAIGGATCGAGVDYVNAGGTVSFADGDTNDKTIVVTVCDDTIFEGTTAETFSAALSGSAVGSPATATVAITDNDTVPTIQFDSANYDVAENVGGGQVTVTVTRTGASNAASVQFTASSDSATGGASCSTGVDFINTSGTLTFAEGDNSESFTAQICNNDVFENDESFDVALSNPTNAVLGTQDTATVTIQDDEIAQPGNIVFSSPNYTVNEQTPGFATITVNRVGGSDGSISASYTTTNGTAIGGGSCVVNTLGKNGGDNLGVVFPDYSNTSGSITFENGDTTPKTFTVPVCDDLTPEPDETVNLTLSPITPTLNVQPEGGLQTTAVLTIIDNDGAPAASVQFDEAVYEYDEYADEATITVTRTGNTNSTVTVNYATSNGTANGGSCQSVGFDYQTTSGTLTFAPTETSKTFSFEICADTLSENPPETVNLTLSNPSGATLGSQSAATLRIVDAATQFVNSNFVIIPELPPAFAPNVTASTSVVVAGAGTMPNRVRVTLYGLSHAMPDDLDILLVSPTGQKFVLLGDAGGANPANDVTLTFEDSAPTPAPNATALISGNYKAANHEANPVFDAPAPGGPYVEPGPSGTAATLNSTFSGNPNGTWTLYLRDDTVNGSSGALTRGFGLEFIAPTAAAATVSGRVTKANGQGLPGVLVSLARATAGERRYTITSSLGYYSFENLTAGEIYVLSVSSRRYTFNPPSRVINVQEDVAGADFIAEQ